MHNLKNKIWHPYNQHYHFNSPVYIKSAKGAVLYNADGNEYIDMISSWWVNIHGHSHPKIIDAVTKQISELDHVIFNGFTHEPAEKLAEGLLNVLPNNFSKVFYSDNGSTACEVAIKMAIQFWENKNDKKQKILALKNGYHGDTFGSMSISDRSIFTKPFSDLLFDVEFIAFPENDKELKMLKEKISGEFAAFIFEPLVQGAGGMLMHKAEQLSEIIKLCKQKDIIIIADEVFTGFGRTGKNFAIEHLSEDADIICLSKGITGGVLPLGVTACKEFIYEAFLNSDKNKTFFHGHSYTANPISCAAAVASLELLTGNETRNNIKRISDSFVLFASKLSGFNSIENVRNLGCILAFDIKTSEHTHYLNNIRDKAYNYFLGKGILIRPLGNIIYLLPPYCITDKQLQYVYDNVEAFIKNEI